MRRERDAVADQCAFAGVGLCDWGEGGGDLGGGLEGTVEGWGRTEGLGKKERNKERMREKRRRRMMMMMEHGMAKEKDGVELHPQYYNK